MIDIRQAALKKLADLGQEIEQEPTCPECKAAVLYECVACSSNNYPPKTKQEPCIGKDSRCPCQDGDACHYKDGVGTKARPVAQPEQEPVAWAVQGCSKMWRDEFAEIDAKAEAKRIGGTCVAYALYTTTPAAQRQWVGLTDEEIDYQAKKDDHGVYFALGALWAEAKLKERNT